MAGAVATRHKVQRLGLSGLHGGHEGGLAGHGDGRGRQARTGVGVPGSIGLQVAAAQVAVEFLAQAVDHGGIGLQQHADAQAVAEDTGNLCTVGRAAGFLLDDAGQDQRFVGRLERRVGRAQRPDIGQAPVHGVQGAAQHGQVGAALGIGIGIGEEAALGRHARAAQGLHEGSVVHACAFLAQEFLAGQGGAHLAPVPAFHQGQRLERFLAAREFLQQHIGSQARGQLIVAGLDLPVLSRDAEPGVQQPCIGLHAGLDHLAGHATRRGAGLDLQLQRGLGQRQRLVQPPPAGTGQHGGQHQQHHQSAKDKAHNLGPSKQ